MIRLLRPERQAPASVPKMRIFGSIRFSLTLWYAFILAVILSLFGCVLYASVRHNLKKDIQLVLVSQADGIGEAVYAFWKAEHLSDLQTAVSKWADVTEELDTTRPIRVLSMEGDTLAFSPSINQLFLPISQKALLKARSGITFSEIMRAPDGQRVLMVTRPVRREGRRLFIIQAASHLHQADTSLNRLRLWLWFLIPATILGTAVVGWFLASLALKPVGTMISQVQGMNEAQLDERLDVPQTGDEIEKLAKTFNELLTRVERGYRRMKQFSAAASHELRTPLTVMKGEIEWAVRKPRSDDDYRRVLNAQLDVINDMAKVVEQLLSVAHAGEGDWIVDWKPVWLIPVLESVRDFFQVMSAKKEVRIEITAVRDACVRGEKNLLERMISNLLENALKHSPPGSKVVLSLVEQDRTAKISVKDSGSGISPEELPKIFDKFFTRKAPMAGNQSTGIGLGLCRWIAEVHQGKITVDTAPGKGSEFTVWLPLIKSN